MPITALFKNLRGDRWIWFAVIVLSLAGVVAVYSSTSTLAFAKQQGRTEYYLIKHLGFLVVGFFLMYAFHLLDFRYFSKSAKWLIWPSLALLFVTIFVGNDINDAKRTLTIPFVGISFQTSDLARFALMLYISRFLSRNQEKLDSWKPFLWIIGVVGLTCFLILPENLSTSLVLFATSFGLFFIGNVRLKHLAVTAAAAIVLASIGYFYLTLAPDSMLPPGRARTWKARIENFKGGEGEDSYQTVQAKVAVASGGVFGRGPGKSIQKNTLPHPYSDFVFAIIIEEYGLFGGVIVASMFILLLVRSIKLVVRSPRAFGAFLAVGLSFMLVFQALIHMGVAVSMLPVTGLTLPLVSMGGTSLIFTSLAFGVILSVSRTIEEAEEKSNGEDATKDKAQEASISEQ